jgi:hypothetical protein
MGLPAPVPSSSTSWHHDRRRLRISGEAAWRLLTGARYDAQQVQLSGDPALAGPLLQVRGIIV